MTTLSVVAQAAEAAQAVDKVLDVSSQYGFPAFCLAVLFMSALGGLSLYFWKVVLPERDARIEVQRSIGISLSALQLSHATSVETLRLLRDDVSDQKETLSRVDMRLSAALDRK
jgi:hypothetical protein